MAVLLILYCIASTIYILFFLPPPLYCVKDTYGTFQYCSQNRTEIENLLRDLRGSDQIQYNEYTPS